MHTSSNSKSQSPTWLGIKSIKSAIDVQTQELLHRQQEQKQTRRILTEQDIIQVQNLLRHQLNPQEIGDPYGIGILSVLKTASFQLNQDSLLEIVVNSLADEQILINNRKMLDRILQEKYPPASNFQIRCTAQANNSPKTEYYLSSELYVKWSKEYPYIACLADELGFNPGNVN